MSVDVKVGEIIDKVFAGFKKITPALVGADIISAFILFIPSSFLSKLGLGNISNIWRTILGIIFLFCSTVIIVILLTPVVSLIKKTFQIKRQQRETEKAWNSLPDELKAIVCTLLKQPEKSGYLFNSSGTTIHLVELELISLAQSTGYLDVNTGKMCFIYCASQKLRDLFYKKPNLFDMKLANSALLNPPAQIEMIEQLNSLNTLYR